MSKVWQERIPKNVESLKRRMGGTMKSTFQILKQDELQAIMELIIDVRNNKRSYKYLDDQKKTITLFGKQYAASSFFKFLDKKMTRDQFFSSGTKIDQEPENEEALFDKIKALIYDSKGAVKEPLFKEAVDYFVSQSRDFDNVFVGLLTKIRLQLDVQDDDIDQILKQLIEEKANEIRSKIVLDQFALNDAPVLPSGGKPLTKLQSSILEYYNLLYDQFVFGCGDYDKWEPLLKKIGLDENNRQTLSAYLETLDLYVRKIGFLIADLLYKLNKNQTLNLKLAIAEDETPWGQYWKEHKKELFEILALDPKPTGLSQIIVNTMKSTLDALINSFNSEYATFDDLDDTFYDYYKDKDDVVEQQQQPKADLTKQKKLQEKLKADAEIAKAKLVKERAQLEKVEKEKKIAEIITSMHEAVVEKDKQEATKFIQDILGKNTNERIQAKGKDLIQQLSKKGIESTQAKTKLKEAKQKAEEKALADSVETLRTRLDSLQQKKGSVEADMENEKQKRKALEAELNALKTSGAEKQAPVEPGAPQINLMVLTTINEETDDDKKKNETKMIESLDEFPFVYFLCLFLGSAKSRSFSAFNAFSVNDTTFKALAVLERDQRISALKDANEDALKKGIDFVRNRHSSQVAVMLQQWNNDDASIHLLKIELAMFVGKNAEYFPQSKMFLSVDKNDIDPIPKSGDDSVLKHNPFVEGLRSDRAGVPMSEISQRLLKILGQ